MNTAQLKSRVCDNVFTGHGASQVYAEHTYFPSYDLFFLVLKGDCYVMSSFPPRKCMYDTPLYKYKMTCVCVGGVCVIQLLNHPTVPSCTNQVNSVILQTSRIIQLTIPQTSNIVHLMIPQTSNVIHKSCISDH